MLSFRGGDQTSGSDKEVIEYDDEEEDEPSKDDKEEEEEFFDAIQDAVDDNIYDNDNDESESESESEEEDEQDEYTDEINTDGIQIEVKVNKVDDPVLQSPMAGLFVSLGVMYLSRKVDLFAPKFVIAARWAFVAYLVLLQAFVMYVRIIATRQNDQTPIELQNPLFTILQNRIQPENTKSQTQPSNDMLKNIASSFLSNKSTILEYDLQQARNMQWGILVSTIIQWLLHFKLEQIQPLIMASLNGFLSLRYSPLFQVYVLGKNLERPFKTPIMMRQEQLDAAQTTSPTINAVSSPSVHADISPIFEHNDNEGSLAESSDADAVADADEYDDDDDTSIIINHTRSTEEKEAESSFVDSTVKDETS